MENKLNDCIKYFLPVAIGMNKKKAELILNTALLTSDLTVKKEMLEEGVMYLNISSKLYFHATDGGWHLSESA